MNFPFVLFRINLFGNKLKFSLYKSLSDISNLVMSYLYRFQNTADFEQYIIQNYGGRSYMQSSLAVCVCVCVHMRGNTRETTKRPTAFKILL